MNQNHLNDIGRSRPFLTFLSYLFLNLGQKLNEENFFESVQWQSSEPIATTDVLTFARVQLSGLLPSSAGIRKEEIGSEVSFLLKTQFSTEN